MQKLTQNESKDLNVGAKAVTPLEENIDIRLLYDTKHKQQRQRSVKWTTNCQVLSFKNHQEKGLYNVRKLLIILYLIMELYLEYIRSLTTQEKQITQFKMGKESEKTFLQKRHTNKHSFPSGKYQFKTT